MNTISQVSSSQALLIDSSDVNLQQENLHLNMDFLGGQGENQLQQNAQYDIGAADLHVDPSLHTFQQSGYIYQWHPPTQRYIAFTAPPRMQTNTMENIQQGGSSHQILLGITGNASPPAGQVHAELLPQHGYPSRIIGSPSALSHGLLAQPAASPSQRPLPQGTLQSPVTQGNHIGQPDEEMFGAFEEFRKNAVPCVGKVVRVVDVDPLLGKIRMEQLRRAAVILHTMDVMPTPKKMEEWAQKCLHQELGVTILQVRQLSRKHFLIILESEENKKTVLKTGHWIKDGPEKKIVDEEAKATKEKEKELHPPRGARSRSNFATRGQNDGFPRVTTCKNRKNQPGRSSIIDKGKQRTGNIFEHLNADESEQEEEQPEDPAKGKDQASDSEESSSGDMSEDSASVGEEEQEKSQQTGQFPTATSPVNKDVVEDNPKEDNTMGASDEE
ncbi:hypothetical protein R1sor_006630 [Riccia sorocarpa]|uniref:Uncharacterized protein n=1 Tax=Riccia sorocarpa TaxID=122646 RepID=A0ABD3HR39_9MARC